MIQLGDVGVFLEVTACGGFSSAARRLKMAKSSVVRQVDRLEAQVGARLLHRAARSVSLTAEGRVFLPYARRLLDNGLEAEAALKGVESGAVGLVSISATGPFARAFVVPHLPAFQARHPGVEVALWLTPARMEVGPEPGQVDIAIRLRSEAGPELSTRRLGEIGLWIVAAPAHLEAHGRPQHPNDLADHRMIELGPPNKANQIELHRGGDTAVVRYRPVLQIDDPEAVLIAAVAGAGVAVVPDFVAAEAVADGRLVRLLEPWASTPIPINLLYRADTAPPTRVRAMVDHLVETISR